MISPFLEGEIHIRSYQSSDIDDVVKLFYDTVHNVNILDYDQKQVEAWAPKEIDIIAWNQSLLANYSLVATIAGKIVGFGDINDDGYLDRLYVHHLYLRQGIATRLCDELERHHEGRITVHASLTAINFFKKRGYSIITNQRVERRGCWLENFVMEKV